MKSLFSSFIQAGFFLALAIGVSCTNATMSKPDHLDGPGHQEWNYTAENGTDKFSIATDSAHLGRMIYLMHQPSGAEYQLNRVPSASGEKYEAKDGYTFWTKGDEFMWSKGDSVIVLGLRDGATKKVMAGGLKKEYYGSYVTESYDKRNEGADWVGVIISPGANGMSKVKVRSRGDRKRGTCTYDGDGIAVDDHTLNAFENGGTIVFSFTQGNLTISKTEETDERVLTFPCSGGGSLAGAYKQINDALDAKQVDKTAFTKTLSWNKVTFYINVDDKDLLTIRPVGLTINNDPTTRKMENEFVTGAEVGDLNGDNQAELMIYVQTNTPTRQGYALGYSVNNGKSYSMFNIPHVDSHPNDFEGYRGWDEFAIVENTFVQRFPIYKQGDADGSPSGGTRQIQYKLKEGEAMRQLVVDKVIQY